MLQNPTNEGRITVPCEPKDGYSCSHFWPLHFHTN